MNTRIDWKSVWNEKKEGSNVIQEDILRLFDFYEVNDIYTFIKALGFARYKLGNAGQCVYFRGQDKRYESLKPVIYRKEDATIDDVNNYSKILSNNNKFLSKMPEEIKIPILQHYGISTNFLDIVDNIWTALWFSSHSFKGNYINVNTNSYCYIYIICFGEQLSERKYGYISTKCGFNIVDLRISAPSTYIRPHCQHGLVVCNNDRNYTNFYTNIIGALKIKTSNALSWLGNGLSMSNDFMFPPKDKDLGYKHLLEADIPTANIGKITEFINPSV